MEVTKRRRLPRKEEEWRKFVGRLTQSKFCLFSFMFPLFTVEGRNRRILLLFFSCSIERLSRFLICRKWRNLQIEVAENRFLVRLHQTAWNAFRPLPHRSSITLVRSAVSHSSRELMSDLRHQKYTCVACRVGGGQHERLYIIQCSSILIPSLQRDSTGHFFIFPFHEHSRSEVGVNPSFGTKWMNASNYSNSNFLSKVHIFIRWGNFPVGIWRIYPHPLYPLNASFLLCDVTRCVISYWLTDRLLLRNGN